MSVSLHVRRRRWVVGLALTLLFLAAPPALAQDPGQQEQGEDPQLPEIAPREIEIRGELQINFPSLERQPLTGFASSPRIPTFPPDHLPTTEAYKQDLDEIPQSLPEVEPVSSRLSSAPDPASGLVEAGGGRYFHRFARGRLFVPLTRQESITLQGDYTGTNGFEPFEARSVDTPYDNLEAGLRFESRRSAAVFSAEAHGFFDDYTLYGAVPARTDLTPESDLVPDRTGVQVGGSVGVSTRGSVPFSLGLQYDRTRYDTQVQPASDADPDRLDEGRLGANASIDVPVGPSRARLDARFSTSGLDGGSALDGDVLTLDTGGHALVVQQGGLTVDAGARLLTFSALVDPTAGDDVYGTYVAPYVNLEWTPAPGFVIFARNLPRLQTHSLGTTYADNPFAEVFPSLRPTLETTRAESGVEVSTGSVRLTAQAGYRYAPTFQYFAPTLSTTFDEGIFGVRYESARIIHGGARLALHGLDRVQASLGATVRDGQLVDGARDIPNFAPLTVDGMLTVSFADDRGFVTLTGRLLSPRPLSPAGTEDVPTFADVDLEGSYAVSPLLEVVAKIENLGAMERWNGYPRPPAVFSAGLRIHW